MDFSKGEIGNFGGFMLILFRASDGNRIDWDFHRFLGKEAVSFASSEKVEGIERPV
jgi:hypothetical protein